MTVKRCVFLLQFHCLKPLEEYLECDVSVGNTQRDICEAFNARGFGHIDDRAWCRLMATIQQLKSLREK